MIRRAVCTLFLILAAGLDGTSAHAADNPQLNALFYPNDGEQPEERALRIGRLDVEVDVTGGAAQTRATVLFENPEMDPVEGEFELALPAGSVVNGYALDIEGKMVDGVLAPRREATLAYEARVLAGIDPGLAQVTQTNAFHTQVFPIFPGKGRAIRLSFVTPLVAGQNFILPLNTTEPIKTLSLHVKASGRQTPPRLVGPEGLNLHWTPTATGFEARIQASDVSLVGAIEIEPPAGPPTVSTTRHKNGDVFFEISDMAPALNDRALNPRRVRVYWDHSLSRRDDNLALEQELLHRYVDEVSPGIVDLVLFSDHGPELQTFEAPSMGERLDDVLRNITYAGATSLKDIVDVPLPTAEACFFFSDGTISIDSYILERVHCPIFTVSTAADAERGFLSVLAKRSAGAYFDLTTLGVDAVLARLTGNSPRVVSVTTPEGRAIDYAVLPAASERFRIVGLAPMSGDVVVTLASGTKRIRAYAISRRASIPMHDAMGALWAADRAAELGATDRPDKDAIVALSRRYSVATDAAVFIVLETGYDYAHARHRATALDRRAGACALSPSRCRDSGLQEQRTGGAIGRRRQTVEAREALVADGVTICSVYA